MEGEKEKYICLNHDESWIFQTVKSPPNCPICKHDACVCSYSGDKPLSRN